MNKDRQFTDLENAVVLVRDDMTIPTICHLAGENICRLPMSTRISCYVQGWIKPSGAPCQIHRGALCPLPIPFHYSISWTLRKQETRIQTFENKCIRKNFLDKNDDQRTCLRASRGQKCRPTAATRSRTKVTLLWTQLIMRQPWDNIEGSLMTGLVEGKRGRGRPKISWIDNILKWTVLTATDPMNAVCDRRSWAALVHSCSQPSQSDYGDMTWPRWHATRWSM